jgi:hypothetical protein
MHMRLLSALIAGVIAFTVEPSSAAAAEVKLMIVPNVIPDQITIWEGFSSTSVGTTPPIVYLLPWNGNDQKKEIRITATWALESEELALRLYTKHTVRPISIPIYRTQFAPGERSTSAKQCRSVTSSDFAKLISSYFTCRKIFNQSSLDSYEQFWAAKGWFDSAFRLFTLLDTPIGWDKEIEDIMRSFEARATNEAAFSSKYRQVIAQGYLERHLAQVSAAELRVVRDVTDLVKAGKLEEALSLNTFAKGVFKGISGETGRTVVNGISEDLLSKNDIYIRSKIEALVP